MRKKNYKGRCIKENYSKCGVCRSYDAIQSAFAKELENDENVVQFWCNVQVEDTSLEDYTSDFFILLKNEEPAVRECVFQKLLLRPKTAELLQKSYEYWIKKGIKDWGLVVDVSGENTGDGDITVQSIKTEG